MSALVFLGLPTDHDPGVSLVELFELRKERDSREWDHTSLIVWAIYNSQSKERIAMTQFHPYKQPKRVDGLAAMIQQHKEGRL